MAFSHQIPGKTTSFLWDKLPSYPISVYPQKSMPKILLQSTHVYVSGSSFEAPKKGKDIFWVYDMILYILTQGGTAVQENEDTAFLFTGGDVGPGPRRFSGVAPYLRAITKVGAESWAEWRWRRTTEITQVGPWMPSHAATWRSEPWGTQLSGRRRLWRGWQALPSWSIRLARLCTQLRSCHWSTTSWKLRQEFSVPLLCVHHWTLAEYKYSQYTYIYIYT